MLTFSRYLTLKLLQVLHVNGRQCLSSHTPTRFPSSLRIRSDLENYSFAVCGTSDVWFLFSISKLWGVIFYIQKFLFQKHGQEKSNNKLLSSHLFVYFNFLLITLIIRRRFFNTFLKCCSLQELSFHCLWKALALTIPQLTQSLQ